MDRCGEIATKIRTAGWRQGSIVSPSVCSQLNIASPPGAAFAVVVSQDCDVVADVKIEPNVEVVAAIETVNPDQGTFYGKHPRCLTLPLAGSSRYFELSIQHRSFVPKAHLEAFFPYADDHLLHADVRTMARWLGKRYTRDAFPDAFNLRLVSARNKLDKVSKSPEGRAITDVFASIEPYYEELDGNEPYRVAFLFVYKDDPNNSDFCRAQSERFAAAFAAAVGSCDGIEVVEDWDVRSQWEATLGELDEKRRFDFDYRSVAPKPGGALR